MMNAQIGISGRSLNPQYIKDKGYKRTQICQAVVHSYQLTDVIRMARDGDMKVGYHLPIYHQSNPRDAFYMSKNFRLRDANFEILEANLNMIKGFNVDYAVIHFISNQIENESYDSLDEFINIADKSLSRLNMLAKEYNITINIEYSSLLLEYSSPKHWIDLVSKYENIGLCLNVGELFFRSKERNKDFYSELQMMLNRVNMIHLYNARERADVDKYGYIPINPDQDPKEGWIDILKTVSYIKRLKRKIPIVLDPNFDYKGEKYFSDGVNWLNDLLNN